MQTIPLADAKNSLSRLVDDVADGQEIVISKHGRPMARLIGVGKPKGLQFGLMKGRLTVPEGFDEELPGSVLEAFEGRD